MYDNDSEETLLSGDPDYVIDAIDNIQTKIDLVAACVRRGVKVLCCGGAGARMDPTRLRFTDISESAQDNLGRAVRTKLKLKHGIESGVELLMTTEKPTGGLVSVEAMQSGNPMDYQTIPGFRIRTIPVLGTSPTAMGVAAAARVVTDLAGHPFPGAMIKEVDSDQLRTMLVRLEGREENRHGEGVRVGVTVADVEFLLKEVFRCKSGVSELGFKDKGMFRDFRHLHLTRWDASRPCVADNLVPMTKEEADAHDALGGMGEVRDKWGADACDRVERLLAAVTRAYSAPLTF